METVNIDFIFGKKQTMDMLKPSVEMEAYSKAENGALGFKILCCFHRATRPFFLRAQHLEIASVAHASVQYVSCTVRN